jgi:hypothetical protein
LPELRLDLGAGIKTWIVFIYNALCNIICSVPRCMLVANHSLSLSLSRVA